MRKTLTRAGVAIGISALALAGAAGAASAKTIPGDPGGKPRVVCYANTYYYVTVKDKKTGKVTKVKRVRQNSCPPGSIVIKN